MSFDAHVAGTPSARWASDSRVTSATEADLDRIRRLIVVAAHPDDETLGAGGLIALTADRDVPVQVVVVTDGSGSHPRSPSTSAELLGARRREEVSDAIGRLAPDAQLSWLGFPDGRAEEFAIQIERSLREAFGGADAGSHIAVVWSGDGHADHEAVGRAVENTASAHATVWSYPIWMWHWADPDDVAVPWEAALLVSLTPQILARKRHAIDAFVSQIEPLSPAAGDERVLEPEVLEHFVRDHELYFASRRGDL